MYKTLHGLTPENLESSFLFSDEVTSCRLRNTENKLRDSTSRPAPFKSSIFTGPLQLTSALFFYGWEHCSVVRSFVFSTNHERRCKRYRSPRLFHSPVPITQRKVSLTAQPGYWTTYLLSYDCKLHCMISKANHVRRVTVWRKRFSVHGILAK